MMAGMAPDHEHEHEQSADTHWTKESWHEWSGYADNVDVEFKFVPDLSRVDDPEETWSFRFGPENDWDREWLERNLAELAAADQDSCCGRGNYAMDTTSRRTEWGATGAIFAVVVAVSVNILSNALWEKFKEIAGRASARAMFDDVATPEEAIEHSKRRVQLRRGGGFFTDLNVESAEQDEETGALSVVVNIPETGETYLVETLSTPSGCPVSRIKRRRVPVT